MYLFLDTETGGLDAKVYSLLSVACIAVNDDMTIHSKFSGYVDCNNIYTVDPMALKINGIDLAKHSEIVQDNGDIRRAFVSWIDALYEINGNRPLTIVGWNIKFDLAFILEQFVEADWWNNRISYYSLDAMSVAQFLIIQKRIPAGSLRLVKVAERFGFDVKGAHDCTVDVQLTYDVFKKMLES